MRTTIRRRTYLHLVRPRGWAHWHDNGERGELENPSWREVLGDYMQLTGDGAVMLDIDSSLRLAYVHSPLHQKQLEEMYLSAAPMCRCSGSIWTRSSSRRNSTPRSLHSGA